ncbi:MAG: MBL fold metallo-hydrolase [Thermomicrobiales bacterium]
MSGDEPILIDRGSRQGFPALNDGLATHGHWDHLSAAALLQAESGMRLLIHDDDRAQVETSDDGLIVRCHETAGRADIATILFPGWNLEIVADFAPWEIKTFRVPPDAAQWEIETDLIEWN